MDSGQLIAAIDRALRDDLRVLAAWLSGSRGRGTADRHSDVDVWLDSWRHPARYCCRTPAR